MKRILDYRNILNRKHPLNRGLVSEWAALPQLGGGKFLYDLCGNYHGTLTNGPTWMNTFYRPGGQGAIRYIVGSSQYVNCGTRLNPSTQSITLAAWVRSTESGSTYVINKNYDGAVVPYSLNLNIVSSVIGGFSFFDGFAWRMSGVVTDITNTSVWRFVSGTWDGTTASYYIDGKLDSSSTPGGTRPTSGTGITSIGAYLNDSNYFNGQIDDVMMFNVCLSAVQIQRLYNETRLGNPNRWNYIDVTRSSPIYLPANHSWRTADGSYYMFQQLLSQ